MCIWTLLPCWNHKRLFLANIKLNLCRTNKFPTQCTRGTYVKSGIFPFLQKKSNTDESIIKIYFTQPRCSFTHDFLWAETMRWFWRSHALTCIIKVRSYWRLLRIGRQIKCKCCCEILPIFIFAPYAHEVVICDASILFCFVAVHHSS